MPDFIPGTPGWMTYGIFGLMTCIAGLMALVGVVMVARVSAARMWPTAPGVALGTHVMSRRGSDRTVSHYPVVEYQYDVYGQTYRGDRLFIGDRNISLGYNAAARQAAKYVVGSPVQVRYN